MKVSTKAQNFIELHDARLNARAGYPANHLAAFVRDFIEFGKVEVGGRAACGTKTDPSQAVHEAWKKLVKILRKEGVRINETPVKHGNKSPTMAGGWWSSEIYTREVSQ